jgi:hypothetical protein
MNIRVFSCWQNGSCPRFIAAERPMEPLLPLPVAALLRYTAAPPAANRVHAACAAVMLANWSISMSVALSNAVRSTAAPDPHAGGARLRIGVIGARRRQQGIGEHVARHLARVGHQVAAIAGSSRESVAAAQEHLQQAYGIEAKEYVGAEAMLESEPLDAVAICSPDRFHREHLQAALSHDLHILCEKPLVFEPCRDSAADAAPLVAASRSRGKVLMVNEQWPYTLPTFAELYPDINGFRHAPQTIHMWLSPGVAGPAMIPNSVPHLLSMVWLLCPAGGDVGELRIESLGPTGSAMHTQFDYRHSLGTTHVALELRQVAHQPRPAGYAIDGCRVRRVVEMAPYGFFLEAASDADAGQKTNSSGRRIRLPDPLALLAADFVQRIAQCRAGDEAYHDTTIPERLHALDRIVQTADECFASCAAVRPMN